MSKKVEIEIKDVKEALDLYSNDYISNESAVKVLTQFKKEELIQYLVNDSEIEDYSLDEEDYNEDQSTLEDDSEEFIDTESKVIEEPEKPVVKEEKEETEVFDDPDIINDEDDEDIFD